MQPVDLLLDHGVQMLVPIFWYQTRTENAQVTVGRFRFAIAQDLLHGRINEKERVEPEMAQLFLDRRHTCRDGADTTARVNSLVCLVSFA